MNETGQVGRRHSGEDNWGWRAKGRRKMGYENRPRFLSLGGTAFAENLGGIHFWLKSWGRKLCLNGRNLGICNAKKKSILTA